MGTRSRKTPLAILAMIAAGTMSCDSGPDAAPVQESEPDDTAVVENARPDLKMIMQGLAGDMAAVGMGIWMDQPSLVRDAAGRVADHPTVPPDQLSAIQSALGPEFPEFVDHDREVHDLSLELMAMADSSTSPEDWLAVSVQIQRGCVACHSTFRERVSAVLNPAGALR